MLPSCFFWGAIMFARWVFVWARYIYRATPLRLRLIKMTQGGVCWGGGANQDRLHGNCSWQGRTRAVPLLLLLLQWQTRDCCMFSCLRWWRLEHLITFDYVTDLKSAFLNSPTLANFIHWCFLIHICVCFFNADMHIWLEILSLQHIFKEGKLFRKKTKWRNRL